MNDKPYCPICDNYHYWHESHQFFFKNKQVEANYRWRNKNLKKWRKYQRDLMRKRRKEGKA